MEDNKNDTEFEEEVYIKGRGVYKLNETSLV